VSFRTALLASVDAARALAGPTGVDIRTNVLTIRTRTWSGSVLGDGTATDSDLVLRPIYPIRLIKAAEVTMSGGQYEIGDIFVDHITPSDGAGVGYTPAQLKPVVTVDNVELLYIITGPHAGLYACNHLETYRPFTYRLVLSRRTTTP
jgi:hypothetical protein